MTEVRQEAYTPEEGDGITPEGDGVNAEDMTQEQIDAQSAKKFDAAQEVKEPENIVNDQVTERPDHIPEKFWKDGKVDVDGVIQGYTELEKKLGSPPEQPPETPPAEGTETKEGEETEPTSKSFDYNAAMEEFARDGALSEATMKTLADAGIPKEAVDMFISGAEAQANAQINELQSMVGGEEEYGKMVTWAAANMTQAEQDAYDKALTSGQETAKFAIRGLQAKYQEAVGKDGTLLKPDAQNTPTDSYQSREQMLADMRDPRYASDPAFRSEVLRKLEYANFDW
jgi:hypothetical protein